MKKVLFFFNIAVFSLCFFGCQKKVSEELRIYSVIHDEESNALINLFTQKTGITVSYLRATTGELINQVIAEKNAPQADVLLGGASSYHIQAAEKGALEKYISPLSKNLPAYARSNDGSWTGFCVLTLGLGINKNRFSQKFPITPYPATWEDLLNPIFKGEIIMTNPVASSTGYLFVQNQLQRLGEEKGWQYLDLLIKNISQFPNSGKIPASMLNSAEYSIGISYLHVISKYNKENSNVIAIPIPQSAGDVDCVSILKNSKNLETAKKFINFMLSKEAQDLMGSITFTTPLNSESIVPSGIIQAKDIALIDYDSQKASQEKDEVLSKWKILASRK